MRFRFLILPAIFLWIGCPKHMPAKGCLAPAPSINAQVNDLCLLKFGTDNLSNPDVQRCVSLFNNLHDDCEHRLLIKKQRCARLMENRSLGNLSMDECIASPKTEGYLVKGCTYPFKRECIERVKREAR